MEIQIDDQAPFYIRGHNGASGSRYKSSINELDMLIRVQDAAEKLQIDGGIKISAVASTDGTI